METRGDVYDERRLFARWLRRAARLRGMRITDVRDSLGISTSRFNRMTSDRMKGGRPELPTDEEIADLSAFLDVEEDVVREMAIRSAEAAMELEGRDG